MNKPVAWALITKHSVSVVPDGSINHPSSRGYVPLYTHPVKELTDDYVFICKRCGDEIGIEYKPTKITDEEINDCIREEASKDPCGISWNLAFNVAKAILRKAQEK